MQIISVARVLVLNDKDEALILKRSLSDDYKPGRFDYPGGGIDEGEAPAEAAVRELEEETGLRVLPNDLRLIYVSTRYEEQLDRSVNRLFYTCVVTSRSVRLSDEHTEYRWVPLKKIDNVFWHPVYSVAIEHARRHKLLPGYALHR